MTTANHVVLANLISNMDGDFNDDTQTFVSAERPEIFLTGSTVAVKLTDALVDLTREFIVTVEEVR